MEKGGNPINVGVGNKFQEEVDRAALADSRLEFIRYYNSDPSAPGAHFGPRWSHTFERMVMPRGDRDAATVEVQRHDGRAMAYVWNGSAYAPDPDIVEVLSRVVDGSGNITGWTLRTKGDELETYDGMGRLTRIDWTDGSFVALTYATAPATGVPFAGLLTAVTEASGRSLQFTYHASGRLQSIVDPVGIVATFAYGTFAGGTVERLKSATYADGKSREYFYDETGLVPTGTLPWPGLLTGIEDERGLRTNTWAYETGPNTLPRAILSTKGDAGSYVERVTITYGTNSATVRSYQSSSVYSDRAVNFETHFGVVKRESATTACGSCGGQIQNQDYDPANGFIDRTTDFRGTTTNYDINARGLETQRIEAESTSVSGPDAKRTTQTDWHATWRQPTERRVLDSAGTLVDLTRFAYNSRGQRTAQCRVDVANTPAGTAARAYQCGSAADAPARVRQTRYVFCDAVNLASPDPIGTSENLAKGCPRIGLLRRVDGPRVAMDARDWTTLEYRLADDSSCATGGACTFRAGDRWKTINALEHVEEAVSHDKAGRILRAKAATGVITDLDYHSRGWPTHRIVRWSASGAPHVLDATTQTGYDDAGRVTKLTQPGGAFTEYGYDTAGRLTDVWDNLGNHIVYTLDSLGNRIKEETFEPGSPAPVRRKAAARTVDPLGRVLTEVNAQFADNPTDPAAKKIQYQHDELGNVTLLTDQRGNRTLSAFDARSRTWRQVGDEGTGQQDANAESQFTMDALDRIVAVKDPKYFETQNTALVTSYAYDGLGDQTQLSSPDTGITAFTDYGSAGSLLSRTDARGITSNYAYDALNRLTSITYPSPGSNVAFEYDAHQPGVCPADGAFLKGRLTRMSDESGSTTWCYDRRGNVVQKAQTMGNDVLLTIWTYDLADRVVTTGYPSGLQTTNYRDSLGRVNRIAFQLGGQPARDLIQSATYLPWGPVSEITYAGGGTLTYSRDQNYWIDKIDASVASGLDLEYTTDDLGNIVGISDVVGGAPKNTFVYDDLSRLTEVLDLNLALIEKYQYDATGNRLSKQVGAGAAVPYTYPATSHRLTSVGSGTRSYDAAGNLQSGPGALQFSYGDHGRMNFASVSGASYRYNGRGERALKSWTGDAGYGEPLPIERQLFYFDEGGRLLSELRTTDFEGGQCGCVPGPGYECPDVEPPGCVNAEQLCPLFAEQFCPVVGWLRGRARPVRWARWPPPRRAVMWSGRAARLCASP